MEASIRTTSGRNFRPVIMTTSLPFSREIRENGTTRAHGSWKSFPEALPFRKALKTTCLKE